MTSETATALPIQIIELAGLPGTGKSTIARHLETTLGGAGISIVSKAVALADQSHFLHRQQRKLQLILRHAGRCGDLYRRSYQLIADSGQRSILDFASVTANFWSIIALMADRRAAGDSVMIADQGLFQAVWSVQLSSRSALSLDAWAPILRAAGIAETLLVHIESDVSVSRRRVSARARNWSRLKSGSPDEHPYEWQTASRTMSSLVEWARGTLPPDQYGARVISVMNQEGAPEAAAAEIAAAYFKRSASKACPSGIQQPRERAYEDRLFDHADGQHRRGANPCARSFAVAEAKRT
jgi:hypothetical protein